MNTSMDTDMDMGTIWRYKQFLKNYNTTRQVGHRYGTPNEVFVHSMKEVLNGIFSANLLTNKCVWPGRAQGLGLRSHPKKKKNPLKEKDPTSNG